MSRINQYGGVVVITPSDREAVYQAHILNFRQAYETWEKLGSPPIVSFEMKDWPDDSACDPYFDPEFDGIVAPHGFEPHDHASWKMSVVNEPA